jgi:hypothetical protein
MFTAKKLENLIQDHSDIWRKQMIILVKVTFLMPILYSPDGPCLETIVVVTIVTLVEKNSTVRQLGTNSAAA